MRREAEFLLGDQKNDGTVAVTRTSATVTGTATSFASTDVGRQFKVGMGSPVYTIIAYSSATSITLDRPFGGVSVSGATYFIFDAYLTPPTDFLQFRSIVDPLMGWQLRHWITQSELNAMDPQRTFFGQPYLLADRMFNNATAGASAPVPQYEAWPFNSSARTLYYTYIIRGTDLIQDDDIPIWPIRSDAIVKGALSDVAKWPGTADTPNPYFAHPEYWKAYEGEFEDMMIEIERRDEDIYMAQLEQWPYSAFNRIAPTSASWLQTHV